MASYYALKIAGETFERFADRDLGDYKGASAAEVAAVAAAEHGLAVADIEVHELMSASDRAAFDARCVASAADPDGAWFYAL